jgi:predicted nucleotidyltransferase component of viral defense system
MIPQAAITQWRNFAPWPQDAQVEQDLILCRALLEIFRDSDVSTHLILRGGTALHKLYGSTPLRYSEDIDLVQRTAGPIGPLLDRLRARLDPLLGRPRRENNPDNVTLRYRMESEIPPVVPLRLKIEINTREHFDVLGITSGPWAVRSIWFEGDTGVSTYTLEELLATKLRALYQRRKGRDLFDLWIGLRMERVDPVRIAGAFRRYMKEEGAKVTREEFEANLAAKVASRVFNEDLRPLLAPKVEYDAETAARVVSEQLLALL